MRVVQPENGNPTLAIVCCQHGDDRFGLDVFDFFVERHKQFQGVLLMIAHTQAVERYLCYIEQDLNRSFPGSKHGNVESRLAAKVLEVLDGIPLVLDVRSTPAELTLVPIVTELNDVTRSVIRLLPRQEVLFMEDSAAKTSLIGNVPAGVSLEYGREYAKYRGALLDLGAVVSQLLSGQDRLSSARTL